MMKAIRVTTDNLLQLIEVGPPLHESIKKVLGGYLEIVHPRGLKGPYAMIVDEEGLCKELPINLVGSALYGTPAHGSPIAGDIINMREEDGYEGRDLVSLNERDIYELTNLITVIGNQYIIIENR